MNETIILRGIRAYVKRQEARAIKGAERVKDENKGYYKLGLASAYGEIARLLQESIIVSEWDEDVPF